MNFKHVPLINSLFEIGSVICSYINLRIYLRVYQETEASKNIARYNINSYHTYIHTYMCVYLPKEIV